MKNIMDSFRLDGKIAVVTGGSGNYGRQMVLALAQAGAEVYTVSHILEENEVYAKEMQEKGFKVYPGYLDQGNEPSINAFLEQIEKEGRSVDILVNNAVLRAMSSYEDDPATFERSMHVNGTGLFMISRAFGEHMAAHGGGSIINIGSYMGVLGPDDTLYTDVGFSGYTAPDYFFHKGGMNNLTRFMASYYGPKNVRCNVLNPGGLFNNQPELFVNRYNQRTFLKRMANQTDIMGAIVFLASDASSYITGTAIPVDGGYSAK